MDAARPTGRRYPTLSLPFAVAASSQEVRQTRGRLAPPTLPRVGRIHASNGVPPEANSWAHLSLTQSGPDPDGE
ncbi:hypothetical protein J2W58_001269 [Pseudomonas psychrotolerans]|nr:hypothetical protein [Pseudomonas psychrotolerans]